jgi:hypothetical protein
MEPMRLLVTDPALQALRQATAWLIMTLGRNENRNIRLEDMPVGGLICLPAMHPNYKGVAFKSYERSFSTLLL